jgi:hypothetical protein
MGKLVLAPLLPLALLALAGLTLACSGAPGAGAEVPPAAPGTPSLLSVRLVKDGTAPGVEALELDLQALRIRTGGLWRTVPLQPGAGNLDLLAATRDAPATLVENEPWPEQESDAIQLVLGPGSRVTTEAAGDAPLLTPQVLAGIMGPPGAVAPSGRVALDLWITAEVAGRVASTEDGEALLPPIVLRVYDSLRTGSIQGVVHGAGFEPVEGATVTAQAWREAPGDQSVPVFRTAVTDRDGNYTLDLLDVDTDWAVVAGGDGLAPALSLPVALGLPPFESAFCDLAPELLDLPAEVGGSVTLPSGAQGRVDLVLDTTREGRPGSFVLGSAGVGEDGTYRIQGIPPGTYRAILNRLAQDPDSGVLDTPVSSAPFTLGRGERAAINF